MAGGKRSAKRDRIELRALSVRQSIAIGEALLTSDVMRVIKPVKGPRPPSLAAAIAAIRRRTRVT